VTYLSHTASFHSNERIAPSNRGIKHLGREIAVIQAAGYAARRVLIKHVVHAECQGGAIAKERSRRISWASPYIGSLSSLPLCE